MRLILYTSHVYHCLLYGGRLYQNVRNFRLYIHVHMHIRRCMSYVWRFSLLERGTVQLRCKHCRKTAVREISVKATALFSFCCFNPLSQVSMFELSKLINKFVQKRPIASPSNSKP